MSTCIFCDEYTACNNDSMYLVKKTEDLVSKETVGRPKVRPLFKLDA